MKKLILVIVMTMTMVEMGAWAQSQDVDDLDDFENKDKINMRKYTQWDFG